MRQNEAYASMRSHITRGVIRGDIGGQMSGATPKYYLFKMCMQGKDIKWQIDSDEDYST